MAKKTPSKLKRPKKIKSKEDYYNFMEVYHYLEKKHKKDFGNYAGWDPVPGKDKKPYLNFWHWLVEFGDVHNGCWFYMPEDYTEEDFKQCGEEWKWEILCYFMDFLGQDYNKKMWLEW